MSISTLTLSPYEPYRSRLALLADEVFMGGILNLAGMRHGWWDAAADWACTYGRFFPGEAPYALLVFATKADTCASQSICTVRAYTHQPKATAAAEKLIQDTNIGWLSLSPFPADERLPTIPAVLADADRTEAARPVVVRYRPGKRCTIRVDDEDGSPKRFAKVFPDDRGRRVHAEAAQLWRASCTGAIAVAVPHSLRWDAHTRTLWQTALAGHSVNKSLTGADGPRLAHQMGQALASISRADLAPHMRFDRRDQWQETRKQGNELCRRVPWLAGAMERLMRELAELHNAAPVRPLRPIHGAPHPHQWLQEGESLALVDFDGFTYGDPELDIATFVSEIDFEKRSKVEAAAINRAFLIGYESVMGRVHPHLFQAYCAHKRLSKALKLAYAIHPEGDTRAEQALGRALVCAFGDLETVLDASGSGQGVSVHEST